MNISIKRANISRLSAIGIIIAISVSSCFAVFIGKLTDAACVAFADIPQAIGVSNASLFGGYGIFAGGGYNRSFSHADFDMISGYAAWGQDNIGRITLTGSSFAVDNLTTETQMNIGFSRKLLSDIHNTLALAVRGDLYSLSYGTSVDGTELGSAAALGLTIAAEAIVYERTRISLLVENLSGTNMGTESDIELPRSATGLIGYSPYNATEMAFFITREAGQDFEYALAALASPHEIITFRAGVITNPDRVTAGLGLHYKMVRFDYAIESHPVLPLSHFVSFGVQFPE